MLNNNKLINYLAIFVLCWYGCARWFLLATNSGGGGFAWLCNWVSVQFSIAFLCYVYMYFKMPNKLQSFYGFVLLCYCNANASYSLYTQVDLLYRVPTFNNLGYLIVCLLTSCFFLSIYTDLFYKKIVNNNYNLIVT